MELKELSPLFAAAVQAGVSLAFNKAAITMPAITKAEAYRLYGRASVDRWLLEGLISTSSPVPGKKNKKLIDRQKLEAIAAGSNRCTYLPSADR